MNNKRIKTAIVAVLIVLTLAFIWGQSLFTADDSSNESSRVTDIVTPFLEIFVGKGNVTEHLVRKLAHFSEFAILGCLAETMVAVRGKSGFISHFAAFAFSVAAAAVDELLQLIPSGRSTSFKDILIDSSGALFGILVAFVFILILRKSRKRRTAR